MSDDPFTDDRDPLGPEFPADDPDAAAAKPKAKKPATPKAADKLIRIAEAATLFHTPDGAPYADIMVGDGDKAHRETHPIRGRAFRQWLAREYHSRFRTATQSDAIGAACAVIEARARYDGPTRPVAVRVGGHDGKLYLDLCDAVWRAVEIDAFGWRIVAEPPIRFRRAAGMLPLPAPCCGMGGVERLRPLLNFGDGKAGDDAWTLAVSWLCAALRDKGPYPILAFNAEQGAGKSLASRLMRSTADPNAAPLRSLPRDDRDLFIAASNAHVLCFDNVSTIQPWQSDTLCRLSTGGGFATRALYADCDETIFDASRPIILNGIDDFLTRADAADRAIVLPLQPIPESARRPESEILAEFQAARPAILCGLLDLVAGGMARLPGVRLERLPRMADFALWATACEREPGAFMRAFDTNRAAAIETVIDADPVASFVAGLLPSAGDAWRGTAGELLDKIEEAAGPAQRGARNFPRTARAVSAALKRAAPFLRRSGIVYTPGEREAHTRRRIITLDRMDSAPPNMGTRSSPSSPPSPSMDNPSGFNGLANGGAGDGHGDGGDGCRDGLAEPSPAFAPTKAPKNNDLGLGGDDGVDEDGCVPLSGACPRCAGEGCGWYRPAAAGAVP